MKAGLDRTRPRLAPPASFPCLAFCVLSLVLGLGRGSVWTTDGAEGLLQQLDRIEMENVSIHQPGTVTLAPILVPRPLTPETGSCVAVWRTAADRSGNIYVATGNQSRLYRLSRAGTPSLVFDGGAGEVLALTSDPAGNVYFGVSPQGKVYRIRPGAKPELLSSTGETYVFSLLTGRDQTLYCATGEHGRLLRILPGGKTEELFAARQAHLTTLAWLNQDRELLVGTSPDGLVYRLSLGAEAPRASVLYDTPLNEVRAIVPDRNGGVYLAANAEGDGDTVRAAVFFVDRDGVRRWQWRAPDSTVFDLALTESPQPSLLVMTGNRGLVYALDTLGQASVRHRLPETQALCASSLRGAVLIGTGNPGKLYQTGSAYAGSGFITSIPYDCVNPARFGLVSYRADVPAGTAIEFETRSGSSEKPDTTWSRWSIAAPAVTSPPGRFIQWRCRLTSSFPNLSPALRRVDLSYRAPNLAPVVKRLDIAGASPEEARKGVSRPLRQVTWETADPDADSLAFEIYYRREHQTSWQRMGRELTDNRFELDTRALPDGWYLLKLVAYDRPTQPVGSVLSADKVSRPFLIDNTAPLIAELAPVLLDAGTRVARVSFTARDDLSPIAAARVSVNAGEWQTLAPSDGIFDSVSERFSALAQLSAGENTLGVWVADAQGNVAAAMTTLRAK